jgi:hypothetical protein
MIGNTKVIDLRSSSKGILHKRFCFSHVRLLSRLRITVPGPSHFCPCLFLSLFGRFRYQIFVRLYCESKTCIRKLKLDLQNQHSLACSSPRLSQNESRINQNFNAASCRTYCQYWRKQGALSDSHSATRKSTARLCRDSSHCNRYAERICERRRLCRHFAS